MHFVVFEKFYICVIDHFLFGQDGWILAILFCVFIDRDEFEVNKNAKKSEANIQPSLLNKLGQ